MRIAYRMGRGSTSQMLGMDGKGDRQTEQIVDKDIEKDESVRELLQLIGVKYKE